MKKITSLLMLLCMFVGAAWAENYPFELSTAETKNYYFIKSGRTNNGLTWWYEYTQEGKIQLTQYTGEDTQLWYFMETTVGENTYLQLFPKNGEGKAMSYENSENGADKILAVPLYTDGWINTWVLATTDGQAPYGLKTSDGKNYLSNNGGVGYKLGMWNDTPKNDSGTAMYFYNTEDILAELIVSAENLLKESPLGTNPGYFSAESIKSLQDAIDAAKAEKDKGNYSLEALTAAIEAFTPIMPQTGKYYVIEAPLFYATQGISKGMYANAEAPGWNTIDLFNKSYYWTVEIKDGKYALKNVATEKYLKDTGSFSETPEYGSINYIGSQQFNIVFGGNTLHANGHNSGKGTSGNIVNWGGGANSASAWMLKEKPNPDLVVTINYSFKYNGKEKFTQSVGGFVGEEFPDITISLPLGSVATKPEGKITEADVTDKVVAKDIALTIGELPFKVSESYEKAVWQVIDMHSNENNYTWKFVKADADVELPVTSKTQTEALGDEFYWAFIGNPFDGYKIYNKAAGSSLTLRKAANDNTPVVMSAINDRNVFIPYSSAAINGAFCWKIDGDTHYINTQWSGSVKVLRGWTAADQGSSCRSFSPASFVLNSISFERYAKIPAGAVGSIKDADVLKSTESCLNACKSDEYDLTKLTALETAIQSVLASDTVPFVDGLYRIQNIFREQMIGFNGTDRVKGDIGKTDVSQIWQINTVGDSIVLMNLNAGAYMKAPNAGNDLVTEAKAAKYKLAKLGYAQYNLKVGIDNLVIYGGGSLGGWYPNPLDSDGAWYIIPATDIEVEIGEAGYATTYLPFDVTLDEGVKAYAVTAIEGESAKLTEKADIPANTAAILEGEGTHTLTIADAASDWTGNLLKGTNVPTNVAEDAYVLSMPEGESVGFYAAKFNVSTDKTNDGEEGAEDDTFEAFKNNANKAYLPASAVPAGARFISFDFGGETAIESVDAENGNVKAVVYDLAGRRVQKAQKGIFIVNGKVVIK